MTAKKWFDKTIVYKHFCLLQYNIVGRDGIVGISTCHKLNGPGIKSQWGRDFSHLT
jgi:hypothetical protein